MQSEYLHLYYSGDCQTGPLFPEVNYAVAKTSNAFAKICLALGISILLVLYMPSIIMAVTPGKLDISKLLARSADKKDVIVEKPQVDNYQPRYDSTLPLGNLLMIRSVGISTQINESPITNYEDSLEKGVWRVPDFGTPYFRKVPTILAAHRYGYLRWSVPYRLKNSFYNLPKVKEGDTVEIVWRQRKYVYEVYKTVEGEEISDYTADLILYTCESLSSPIRVFKYARLLQV